MTSINGIVKGYWYEDGYLRTSSKEYDIENLQNRFIHLTNDAIQKNADDYQKHESGNKISY
jgi:tubulin polyglutamylase TTLL1